MERPRRHLTVPELTCTSCQELAKELDRTRDLLRQSAVKNSGVVEELSDAHTSLRVLGNKISNLEGQLTKQARQSTNREKVDQVIEHWRSHGRKTGFPEGGKNWATIEKALALMANDEAGDVEACKEAIDGLHLAPYQHFDKRYATPGRDRQLRRDVEHALGDEVRIERCRRIARQAKALPLDEKFRLFEQTKSVHESAARVLMDALEQSGDGVVEVDGIVVDVERTPGGCSRDRDQG